jgi:uncharacterized protein YjbI with pentapeptide repeats
MKVKLSIKNRFTGSIIFEYEKENNTIKETVLEAVKQGADLRGAYLQGADLQGADLQGAYLQGAYLRGAYLRGVKIKAAAVFTGLYTYIVIPYITEENETRVKMGCHDRSLKEWEENFWNNNSEFPNDGSLKSNMRLMAFEVAKKWIELTIKNKLTHHEHR